MDAIALHVRLVEQVTRAVDELLRPTASARSWMVELCVEGALACDVVTDDGRTSDRADVGQRSRWATSVLCELAQPDVDATTRHRLALATEVGVVRFCAAARRPAA